MEKYSSAGHATDDNTTQALAYWILKATNVHSEYVILNYFPLQQRLHERASMLGYTYGRDSQLKPLKINTQLY